MNCQIADKGHFEIYKYSQSEPKSNNSTYLFQICLKLRKKDGKVNSENHFLF